MGYMTDKEIGSGYMSDKEISEWLNKPDTHNKPKVDCIHCGRVRADEMCKLHPAYCKKH